jgi:predicted MPP superfamily phosphohydrolase
MSALSLASIAAWALVVLVAWTVRGRPYVIFGLWGRGKDRLYVHRGTGHYGFPLRLGVPPEESLLELHRASA